jgi:hypothetical protein
MFSERCMGGRSITAPTFLMVNSSKQLPDMPDTTDVLHFIKISGLLISSKFCCLDERSSLQRSFCNWDQMGSSSVQIVLGLPNFIWWKRLMVPDGHVVTLAGCICFQNQIYTLSKYDRFCAEGGLIQIFQQNIFEKRISPWSYK